MLWAEGRSWQGCRNAVVGGSLVCISVTQGVEGGASERRSFALKDELQAVGVERRTNKKDGAKSWMRRERGCSGPMKIMAPPLKKCSWTDIFMVLHTQVTVTMVHQCISG